MKNLVLFEDLEFKSYTNLYCDPRDETLYAEYANFDDNTTEHCTPEYDTIELAVSLEQIKKIRDFLNERIEKMERRLRNNG